MVEGLVTVIVPCFNYARYLRQCVGSLLQQSYAHWECVIVDDGSTDETPALCAEFARTDPRIRVLRQSRSGPSAARNAGIRHATGEYLQFLDADDLLQSQKLEVHVAFLRAHPEVQIVAGDAAYVDDDLEDPPRRWVVPRVEGSGTDALRVLIYENPLMIHGPMLRRSVIEAVGAFDDRLRGNEDWELWLRCGLRGCRFAYCSTSKDALALVRVHGQNSSSARRMMLESALAVREMLQEKLPPELRKSNTERIALTQWRRGLELMKSGQWREGWKTYSHGLRLSERKFPVLLRLMLVIPGVERIRAVLSVIRKRSAGKRSRA